MPYSENFKNLLDDSSLFDIQTLTNAGIDYNDVKFCIERSSLIINCHALNPVLSNCLRSFVADLYNPCPSFHVGLGNPNADILIVGNELAINPMDPNPKALGDACGQYQYGKLLFVNEVLLNYYIWKIKNYFDGLLLKYNCCIQDPEFPPSFCGLYNREKPGGHYWQKINAFVSLFVGTKLDFKTKEKEQSFFKHVFLTELNAIPAKKSHSNHHTDTIRTQFENILTKPFYSDFKYKIFSCYSYLKTLKTQGKKSSSVSALWEQTLIDQGYTPLEVAGIPVGVKEKIIGVYKCGDKTAIVTKHFNAHGWENKDFDNLKNLLSL